MLSFLVNPRDGGNAAPSDGCGACCCEPASARPGETNKWVINYSPWVAPLGSRGLAGAPTFQVELLSPCPTPSGGANLPPTNTDYSMTTAFDTPLSSNVSSGANDPEAGTLIYGLLPLYGPANGTLSFNANGTFTYTPRAGFSGYDAFWFTTSDGINRALINKVTIRVNPAAPAPALPAAPVIPIIWVDPARVVTGPSLIEFPLAVSPAARPGDLYRLSVRAQAVDCDGGCFAHVSCYDIAIGKC